MRTFTGAAGRFATGRLPLLCAQCDQEWFHVQGGREAAQRDLRGQQHLLPQGGHDEYMSFSILRMMISRLMSLAAYAKMFDTYAFEWRRSGMTHFGST